MSIIKTERFKKGKENLPIYYLNLDIQQVESVIKYIKTNELQVVHLFENVFDSGYYITHKEFDSDWVMDFWDESHSINNDLMKTLNVGEEFIGLSKESYEDLECALKDTDLFIEWILCI